MAGAVISGTSTTELHGITDGDKQYTGKSYRRIWWNTYQSRWDGLLPQNDAGASDDHYVVKDIESASFTTIEAEDRSSGRPSCYFDSTAKKVHIMSAHNTTVEFWTLAYNDTTDTYSFSVGSAGAGVTVTGMTRATNSMAMALTKTPNGDIWVFSLNASNLQMQHSSDDGANWEGSATNLTASNGNGAVDCLWFANGGTNYVCVFGSEDDLVGSAAQYFYYIDENAAAPTTPGNWTNENASIPAVDGGAVPDNHVCMAKDSNELIGIVYKQGGTGENDIKMITRTAAGTWDGTHEVAANAANNTRPAIACKKQDGSTDEEFIIFLATTGGGTTIVYKTTPTTSISFSSPTTIFEDTVGTDNFNDPVVPQGDFIATSDSNFAVIAENTTDEQMWYNTIAISAPAGGGVTGSLSLLFAGG